MDTENESGNIFYVATSKTEFDFNLKTIRELNEKRFNSFDEYVKKRHNAFHIVDLNLNSWLNSRCDCYSFWKNYTCKHIVGLALRNKCCKLPRKALTVQLKKKKTKGRKPKASSALKK